MQGRRQVFLFGIACTLALLVATWQGTGSLLAAQEAAWVLGPLRDRVAHVALGGDRSAVSRVLESRSDLAWLRPLALERFFDVPEPRLRVLEALPYQLYAAKVVEETS